MQVVHVDPNSVVDLDPHEGEPLRSQAIVARCIRTLVPFDPLEVDPVEVGQSVQARPERYATAGRRPERMVVILVQGGVVVEIFLNMDDVVAVLGELRAYGLRVDRFIARHVVALQDLRQAGNVHGERGESPARGSHGSRNGGRGRKGKESGQ